MEEDLFKYTGPQKFKDEMSSLWRKTGVVKEGWVDGIAGNSLCLG